MLIVNPLENKDFLFFFSIKGTLTFYFASSLLEKLKFKENNHKQ